MHQCLVIVQIIYRYCYWLTQNRMGEKCAKMAFKERTVDKKNNNCPMGSIEIVE